MATSKVTFLINGGTLDAAGNVARLGGFSESWYWPDAAESTSTQNAMNNLLPFRAALLPANATIVGQRIQGVNPVGQSRSFERVFKGSAGLQNDLPQLALTWNMRSVGGLNRRLVTLRGCPDARVVNGEYKPEAAYNAALQQFFGELNGGWQMKGRVRTNPQLQVSTVDANGLVTTATDHGIGAGDYVIFLRTRNTDGELVKGVFFVAAAPDAFTFRIFNWANEGWGTITKGKVRIHEEQFFDVQIDQAEVLHPDANVRKVGRPFNQFHGRQSTKR